jgi:serine/threonine-protein kinase
MALPEPPAALVAGKYRLTRLLGRGGMGSVWEGIHETLGTRVAVKFIDAEHAGNDDIRQRFVNEARAAARLDSKHVVKVYDQSVGDDGRPYIVMEFLSGESLDSRLERERRLSLADTTRFVLHVSRALARAHDHGIVHRDLKPENVFLVRDEDDRTDIAKVLDFGIAKFIAVSPEGSSSTRTGAVLGTPQYMSPEQARGLRSIDRRTDLWSLGVIAYRCLVGSLPFRGEAVGDLLVNICTSAPPVPSTLVADLPNGFDAWVKRALAREPDDRFQTARELADSLASLAGVDTYWAAPGSGPALGAAPAVPAVTPGVGTAAPFTTTQLTAAKPKRSPRALVLLLAIGIVGVAIVVFAATRGRPRVSAEATPAGAASSLAAPPGATTPAAASPEVTPVTSVEAPVPPASSDVPSPNSARAVEPNPSHAHPRPTPKAAKASRPADLLGY